MRGQRCKGFRDLSPEEMARFRGIERVFTDCCVTWGYREVRTPTLEYLHLFTATGTLTPGMLGKVYSFLDWDGWSGQRVVLRPDGTIPVARYYIDNLAAAGFAKLFYTTSIFRFEDTGRESRERWQGGVELIGAGSPAGDVELITMALGVLARLGIKKMNLRLSHAGLLRGLLARLKLSPREQDDVLDQILDGDGEALARIKSERPGLDKALRSLLELKGNSSGILRNVRALFNHGLPEMEAALDNLISIVDCLETLGYRYRIDISSGRGFEYYTGLIFQLFVGEVKVGGGGRYDALIPLLGGDDVPAAGFALYFDHLVDLMAPAALPAATAPRVLIRAVPATLGRAFGVAARLQEAGYRAEICHGAEIADDIRWLIEINEQAPVFVARDRVAQTGAECDTIEQLLPLLGEVDGNQDRTA